MANDTEKFDEYVQIGFNNYDYAFAVGKWRGSWHGFAVGRMSDGDKMLFFFSGCANMADRDECIKKTCAIALSPEYGYGGISTWMIEENLRAGPEDYRCRACGEICCDSDDHEFQKLYCSFKNKI